jgi:hypothetical protein
MAMRVPKKTNVATSMIRQRIPAVTTVDVPSSLLPRVTMPHEVHTQTPKAERRSTIDAVVLTM